MPEDYSPPRMSEVLADALSGYQQGKAAETRKRTIQSIIGNNPGADPYELALQLQAALGDSAMIPTTLSTGTQVGQTNMQNRANQADAILKAKKEAREASDAALNRENAEFTGENRYGTLFPLSENSKIIMRNRLARKKGAVPTDEGGLGVSPIEGGTEALIRELESVFGGPPPPIPPGN